jgi:hypothetical protein
MTSRELRRRIDQLADRFAPAVCPKCSGTGQVVNDGRHNAELWRRIARLAPGRDPRGPDPEIPPEFFDCFPRLDPCHCTAPVTSSDELLARYFDWSRDQQPPAGPATGPDDPDQAA